MISKQIVRMLLLVTVGASYAATGSAQAQESTTYTYDALGRVTAANRSGGPMNGANSGYVYDPAGNRTNVTVSNSPNGSRNTDTGSGATASTARYVIVPLNGYTLIKF